VKTGADGRIKIVLTDQSTLALGPNSELQVTEYLLKAGADRTGWFKVWSGRLRAVVSKWTGDPARNSYRFSTPTAVAGVRGTDLVLDVSPREGANPDVSAAQDPSEYRTEIAVLEGAVEVAGLDGIGAAQVLTAGMASQVLFGGAPSTPRPLTPDQAAQVGELEQFGDDTTIGLPTGELAEDVKATLGRPATALDAAGLALRPGADASAAPPISQQPGDVRRNVPVTVEIRRVD
jgi:hypothetical protein